VVIAVAPAIVHCCPSVGTLEDSFAAVSTTAAFASGTPLGMSSSLAEVSPGVLAVLRGEQSQ
jgi:hypothetical protein